MPDQNDTYGNDKTDDNNARRQDDQSYGDELTTNDAAENLAIDQTEFELVVLTDRYEIERELGQGGMGKVLLARDKKLGRQVAIKSLLPELAKSSIGKKRFLREARSAATLNHPNIVQIHDLGMTAQGPFFVMEYVQGGSLLDRLNKGRVEADEAVNMICQLCNAVATAHEAGIIHRDIKPANIMLDLNGIPKLTDFGIARQDSSDDGLTKFGTALGTIDYMPPEQRRNAADADARSDIWSLAGTLYLMLTGDPPLVIDLELIPPAYRTTLSKALKLRKEDRFQSALELREQLIQNTSKSEAKQPEPSAPVDRTPPENTPSVDEQVRDLMDSAEAHYSNEEDQKAIDDYTKAIELKPDHAVAYKLRANAYRVLEEYLNSIDDCNKAIGLKPEDGETYYIRGYAYSNLGDHRKAIVDFTKAIELEPDYARAYENRAFAYELLNEHQKAIDDYTKMIELNHNDVDAYRFRAYAYRQLGEHQKALDDYTEAIELDPYDADKYNNRGFFHEHLGEYQKAIDDYTKAIELNPEDAGPYYNRGFAYGKLREYRQAIDDYTKAIELNPVDANVYNKRGVTYEALGEYQKAIDDYTKAIELNPDYADAYNNRGHAYDNLGEYQKAIDDCTKAIELDPNVHLFHETKEELEKREAEKRAIREEALAQATQFFHDQQYSDATAVLSSIPVEVLNHECEDLLEKATVHQKQLEDLQALIKESVDRYQLEGLITALDECLGLKTDQPDLKKLIKEGVDSFQLEGLITAIDECLELKTDQPDLKELKEEISKVQAQVHLEKAQSLLDSKDFDSAADRLSRASVLDPTLNTDQLDERIGQWISSRKQVLKKATDMRTQHRIKGAIDCVKAFMLDYPKDNKLGTLLADLRAQRKREVRTNWMVFAAVGLIVLISYLIIGASGDTVWERGDALEKQLDQIRKSSGNVKPTPDTPSGNEVFNRSDPAAFFIRGQNFLTNEKYKEAIDDFTNAILLDPAYYAAYNNRGIAYHDVRKYQKAIDDYTKVIELTLYNTVAYYNRGRAYRQLSEYQKAIEDYTKAIEQKPDYANAYYNRANAYKDLGETELAEKDRQKYQELTASSD